MDQYTEKVRNKLFKKIVGIRLDTTPISGIVIAQEKGLTDELKKFVFVWDLVKPALLNYRADIIKKFPPAKILEDTRLPALDNIPHNLRQVSNEGYNTARAEIIKAILE